MPRRFGDYTSDLVREIRKIVEKEHPITARGVFYRMVSAGHVENNRAEYTRIAKLVSTARWSYLRRTRSGEALQGWEIPFEWIVDESRELLRSGGFDGLEDYLDYLSDAYGRNQWIDQPNFVMVGTEKAAMSAILNPIITKWNIPFLPFIGQVSDTLCYEVGMAFAKIEKPVKVLYLGDHDGSGLGIPQAAGKKIREISQRRDIEWIRVAITIEHFIHMDHKFRIPVNPNDPYRNDYFWSERIELDAMPSDEVRGLLDAEIQKHVDMKVWKASQRIEKQEQAKLDSLVPEWKKDLD